MRDLGFPRAGPVAAFLLAFHPWHIRFGADGRGYSFVVLATLAGGWLLLRALRAGRWRDWLAFTASQAALLWTFPLAVYVPLVRGVAGALACGLGRAAAGVRAMRFTRFAVATPLVVYGLLPTLALGGLARAWLRGGAAERAALAGIVLPAPLFLLHRELQGFALFHRFAAFGLACVVPLLALGLEGAVAAALRPARVPRAVQSAALALGLAGFAGLLAPQLRLLATRPIEPTREVIAFLARAEWSPAGAIRAGVGLGRDVPRVYDPSIREVNTVEELAAVAREARGGGKRLHVFNGYGTLNRGRRPALLARLDDPRLFEPLGHVDGLESESVFRVLRYTGEPLP